MANPARTTGENVAQGSTKALPPLPVSNILLHPQPPPNTCETPRTTEGLDRRFFTDGKDDCQLDHST